jgi:hypothetical protein
MYVKLAVVAEPEVSIPPFNTILSYFHPSSYITIYLPKVHPNVIPQSISVPKFCMHVLSLFYIYIYVAIIWELP